MTETPPSESGSFQRRLGLRSTVALLYAAGALLVSAVLSVGTYVTTETYLLNVRQNVAVKQAMIDAGTVRRGLLSPNPEVPEVIKDTAPSRDTIVFVRYKDAPYSSDLTSKFENIPEELQEQIRQDIPSYMVTTVTTVAASGVAPRQERAIITGTPLPAVDAEFYEIAITRDLNQALEVLPGVLAAVAAATTLAGALVGWWAARTALTPLNAVAAAAAEIAEGNLDARVPNTEDPELKTLVRSFNTMAERVNQRIERERRFTADVSHELRSPLTTLTTSVHLLKKRRNELSDNAARAVDLIDTELGRFSRALSDLLELSRLDAGQMHFTERLHLDEIIRNTVSEKSPTTRVHVKEELVGSDDLVVLGDKSQMHRVFVNLLDNAYKYGGGATAVEIRVRDGVVVVHVDDSGEGVAEEERDRIFQRFFRSGSRRSIPGTGLGLSLVAEMIAAHGGSTGCAESPYGGARFTVHLPIAPPEEDPHADPDTETPQETP